MRRSLNTICALIGILFLPGICQAVEANLQALFENFHALRRTAIEYLRTENTDLALIEIDRLQARLSADTETLASDASAQPGLGKAMAEAAAAVTASSEAAERGEHEAARNSLEQAAAPLRQWRQGRGMRIFADCIAEAGQAYEQLDVFRSDPPDLGLDAPAGSVMRAAQATMGAWQRCDEQAVPAIRTDPEFRRLIDGMTTSLRQIPDAVLMRDASYLHRLLIEQRSFERLLAFRFG
jgi:hypothetical protein